MKAASLHQLDLPILIDVRQRILGQPIVRVYFDAQINVNVAVLGGRFAGDDFVYLNHFTAKIANSQHYVGSARDIPKRLKQHRRKWPRYQLTAADLAVLDAALSDPLQAVVNRVFRRKATFLNAVVRQIGTAAATEQQLVLLSAARKHAANGLMMAVNQRGIAWHCVQVWQANRAFEMYLKRQKNIRRHCPVCQGTDVPF